MGPLAPCIKKAKGEHSPRECTAEVPLKHLETSLPFPVSGLFFSLLNKGKKKVESYSVIWVIWGKKVLPSYFLGKAVWVHRCHIGER